MKDRIEDFIRSNRQAFDEESPRGHVWKNIDRQLRGGNQRSFTWIWQAAAVLFFATSAWLFAERQLAIPAHTEASANFSQVEDFYFQEISQRRAMIQGMTDSGVSAEAELQKLDAMYLVLKDQFREKPSQEVIEALTLNLIVRLDLLNQVVADLEEDGKRAPEGVQAEI